MFADAKKMSISMCRTAKVSTVFFAELRNLLPILKF